MEKTKERKVVSFREVHKDLEEESMFLKKGHDIEGYKEKANFLAGAGFNNSIAAKLYSSISENSHMIDEYDKKYHGQYRFILKPQLERLCEKYNLFVRKTEHFLGDIPEENIKEMMNFHVHLEDLDRPFVTNLSGRGASEISMCWNYPNDNIETQGIIAKWIEENQEFITKTFTQEGILVPKDVRSGFKVKMNDLNHLGFEGVIQIAAVEELFAPEAFEETKARVPGRAELTAKQQVDLDPIVLCETKHGYIVITAWGDEANDELILNPNKN